MGISSDGMLVFGIEWEDDDTMPEFMGEFDDFDEYLDSLNDLPDYGEPGHSFSDQQEARDKIPVDMVRHCSYDYPMFIFAVRGYEFSASRGYPMEITADKLKVDPEKLKAFKLWLAERGIQGEPSWFLCSIMG